MRRLVLAFAGRTYHSVGNLKSRLTLWVVFTIWTFHFQPVQWFNYIIKSFLASGDFCYLLITFANIYGPISRPTEHWSWSRSKLFDIWKCSWKKFLKLILEKLPGDDNKNMKSYPACFLFNLVLYIPVNNFQLCQNGSSWVEPVLSKDKCVLLKDTTQWYQWGSNLQPLGLESSTLALSHCAPSLASSDIVIW